MQIIGYLLIGLAFLIIISFLYYKDIKNIWFKIPFFSGGIETHKRNSEKKEVNQTNKKGDSVSDIKIENVSSSLIRICNEYKQAKPFIRNSISLSYKGQNFEQEMLFNNIRDHVSGKKMVFFSDKKNQMYFVYSIIKINDFPELKSAHEGQEFTVKGLISRVDSSDIEIKKLSISL